jgi:hypothetical protein
MRAKRVLSSLILAIYLMASCGGMLSVILCHCTRSQHVITHHCYDHCCHHHDSGDGIKLPTNCCNHDHSTEINLYNHEKSLFKALTPAICALLPALQEDIEFSTEQNPVSRHLDRRKTPLLISEFVSIKGLRAPPVIA